MTVDLRSSPRRTARSTRSPTDALPQRSPRAPPRLYAPAPRAPGLPGGPRNHPRRHPRQVAGERAARLTLTPDAARALLRTRGPLNIRELHQAMGSAVALAVEDVIDAQHLPPELVAPPSPAASRAARSDPRTTRSATSSSRSLHENKGNVTAVARAMGKAPAQIHRWMRRFHRVSRLVPRTVAVHSWSGVAGSVVLPAAKRGPFSARWSRVLAAAGAACARPRARRACPRFLCARTRALVRRDAPRPLGRRARAVATVDAPDGLRPDAPETSTPGCAHRTPAPSTASAAAAVARRHRVRHRRPRLLPGPRAATATYACVERRSTCSGYPSYARRTTTAPGATCAATSPRPSSARASRCCATNSLVCDPDGPPISARRDGQCSWRVHERLVHAPVLRLHALGWRRASLERDD